MAKAARTLFGQRLYTIVNELGYVDTTGIQLTRLAADITRAAQGNIDADALRAILGRGREIKCDELVVICDGLDVHPNEILYGEDGPPERRYRPPGTHLMDRIPPLI